MATAGSPPPSRLLSQKLVLPVRYLKVIVRLIKFLLNCRNLTFFFIFLFFVLVNLREAAKNIEDKNKTENLILLSYNK